MGRFVFCFGLMVVATGVWFEAAARADDTICADRPTKSNNACTVDAGTWQIETDLFNATLQRSGGVTTDTWLITNPTLKYGLASALDFEASIVPYEIVGTHDAFGTHTLDGNGDLFLHVKYEVAPNAPAQAAVEPYVKLPTRATASATARLKRASAFR